MIKKRFDIILAVFVITAATILDMTTINGSSTAYSTKTGYGFADSSEMSGSISSFSGGSAYDNNNMSDADDGGTYNTTIEEPVLLPGQPTGGDTSADSTIENMTILPTPSEEEMAGGIASLGGNWKDLDQLK